MHLDSVKTTFLMWMLVQKLEIKHKETQHSYHMQENEVTGTAAPGAHPSPRGGRRDRHSNHKPKSRKAHTFSLE